jgi:hypothetical protein
MIIHCSDNERCSMSLNIGTGTKVTTGKEYIYCELSYRNKKNGKYYNKIFPAAKFDDASKQFYALYNNTIPTTEIPMLFK